MRAFIALELSDEVREELSRLEEEFKKTGADARWVAAGNIHLTLKFLGETDEDAIAKIKDILSRVASANSAFRISLFKLGAFPKPDYPRVVWVGIDAGCAQAEKIASTLEDELEKIGFAKEDRPFTAHLTLGRVRSGKNRDALKEKILSLEVRPVSCPISGITLFRSTLTPKGPIYTPIHVANLTD